MDISKLPLSEFQRRVRVKQWFPFEASYSMDILRSYAQSVEAQIRSSLGDYAKRRKDWEAEYDDLLATEAHPEEPDFEHSGLKGHVKDLEAVFTDYFPSLQRSSALTSIYGFFESELNKLCDRVKPAISAGLRVQDLNGGGVERARNYLIKVGGFDLSAGEKEWNTITKIREVRNCFVHADGIMPNEKVTKIISAYASETKFLLVKRQRVELLEGYLEEVVTALLGYFEVLARAAKMRFPDGK